MFETDLSSRQRQAQGIEEMGKKLVEENNFNEDKIGLRLVQLKV